MKHVYLFAAAVVAFSLAMALPVGAQNDDPAIGYRQKVMATLGANMGAIGDILKFNLPHRDNIARHAQIINEAAGLIPSAFKKEVTAGPTDAKASIWQEWSEYEEKAKDLQDASAKLARVAGNGDSGALMEAVQGVGKACKACHKEYRKPKAESYKRM